MIFILYTLCGFMTTGCGLYSCVVLFVVFSIFFLVALSHCLLCFILICGLCHGLFALPHGVIGTCRLWPAVVALPGHLLYWVFNILKKSNWATSREKRLFGHLVESIGTYMYRGHMSSSFRIFAFRICCNDFFSHNAAQMYTPSVKPLHCKIPVYFMINAGNWLPSPLP